MLSIRLVTFHLSDDVVRGFEPGGFKNVSGVLYSGRVAVTLVLAARRSGYIIIRRRLELIASCGDSLEALAGAPASGISSNPTAPLSASTLSPTGAIF